MYKMLGCLGTTAVGGSVGATELTDEVLSGSSSIGGLIKSANETATSAESRRAVDDHGLDAEAAKHVERVGIIAVASDEDDTTILELDAEAHDVDDQFLVQGLLHIVALRAIDEREAAHV